MVKNIGQGLQIRCRGQGSSACWDSSTFCINWVLSQMLGDNAFDSVHLNGLTPEWKRPLVLCLSVCNQGAYADNLLGAVNQLLIRILLCRIQWVQEFHFNYGVAWISNLTRPRFPILPCHSKYTIYWICQLCQVFCHILLKNVSVKFSGPNIVLWYEPSYAKTWLTALVHELL